MKKIVLFVLLFMIVTITNAEPNNQTIASVDMCASVISTYPIDPKIKSEKGWRRIFGSEKWKKRFKLDAYDEEELECLEDYVVQNAMNIKQYDRFVGMELKL